MSNLSNILFEIGEILSSWNILEVGHKPKLRYDPKKKENSKFWNDKKKTLVDSDKGSWFDQPSTSQIQGEESREAQRGAPLYFSFAHRSKTGTL